MLQPRPASRKHAKPIIGLYAESGCGKTYTALILARGFVGQSGKICMIETESGRGEAYADPSEYPEIGGYDVIPLVKDFSPKTYHEAIAAAESGGYDALIIDSASHEWEGSGGVLDMASKNQMDGKKGMLVWQQPKIDHQKHFMLKVMQTPLPLVILCMRAKYPMIVVPGKEPVRSKDLEPKQSEDILYEMFVHGWIEKDTHNFKPTKITAASLKSVFKDGKPISLDTGRQLAEWAKGAASRNEPQQSQSQPSSMIDQAKDKARAVHAALKNCNSGAELWDCFNTDFADDLAFIKDHDQKSYDWLNKFYNDLKSEMVAE